MILDPRYNKHLVFEQLSKYAEYYNDLAISIMGFSTQGTSSFLNIDTYVYSSMHGTLESIADILIKGRINDAYALMRKFYDAAIINIYSNLYLEDNFSLDNFMVQQIENWFQGKERLPEYRVMSKYIRDSNKLSAMTQLLHKDDTFKKLRDRCNSHTHYNFYHNLLLNDSEIRLENRLAILSQFSRDLRNIFLMHFAYLFSLKDHYMMSSYYVDCMDCGVEPEEGSQYLVASFIQEMFDSEVKKFRPDLAAEIKNRTNMKLE